MNRISFLLVAIAMTLATACNRSADTSTTAGNQSEGPSVSLQDGRLVFADTIRFEFDSAALAPESTDLLDAIARFLTSHSGVSAVSIQGHTDDHGADDHNQELSAARAQSVADYLRSHGVTQELATEGFGASRLLCTDSSDECDARNRRVEFIVTGE